MRILVVATLAIASCCALAQSEPEILSWAEEGRKQVDSGSITELQYHRELYRRIVATPSSVYQWKAENLRIIGYRVEVYEDIESGKLTKERGERRIAEQQAQWEAEGQERERAQADARQRAYQAAQDRQQHAQQQDEAQRRAIALQLLQSGAMRVQPQMQQPYMLPIPKTTNCTSHWIGNQMQTVCR